MSAILDELLIAETRTFKQVEFKTSIDESLGPTILNVLKSFGIEGKIVGVDAGPKVTSVYFDPAPGYTISSIEARSDDLQVRLGKTSLKIIMAPEKKAIAIEVPNQDPNEEPNIIPFGNVFHSNHAKMSLPAALGVDTKGKPIYLDIAKTPHLLIAGQTGSGKSSCLNSIIASLILNCRPVDLQFLLIDPKRVGFKPYKKLHNLISGDIITDINKAILALEWLVQEMETRNTLIDECGCEDIKEFKNKLNFGQLDGVSLSKAHDMPYIVAVIDEYQELMSQSSKKVEGIIQRLAQRARNVGIHLILATQRPSIKVISGDIKANLPTRIALKTSSAKDSETILGKGGAEKLLPRQGDMLLSINDEPKRIHGCYISKEEIEKIIPQLPSKDLFYFNREDIFSTDFQTYLDNSSKDCPTWGEINAVCKAILENLGDYLDEKELSIKLGLGNEELSIVWQQLNDARNNPEICELIFKHYIQRSAFAESQFIKFIIFTNFYFEDSKGDYPFLKYILEKAIKEEDETAFKSAQHFCNSACYNTKIAKDELDKLGNQETENSKKYLALKSAVTAQASPTKNKQAEQKRNGEDKKISAKFSHGNSANNPANFTKSDSLTRIESIYIKKAQEAFYEKGETMQALEWLEPIYKAHSSNDNVLEIYLPVLVNYNVTLAKQTIKSLKISSPAICLAEIEIALLENDLKIAERKIEQGKKLWPNNEKLKCYEVLWLIKLAIISGEAVFIEEATDVAKTFAETDNKAEKTLQARMCEYLSALTGLTDLADNFVKDGLYSNLYSRDLGIKEITVGPEQTVKSIQLAINMLDASGTISVDAGLYKENLIFPKSVKIIGCRDSILNKASYELPIIVLNYSRAYMIPVSIEIEGIIFTHNENITFYNLNDYVRRKNNTYSDGEEDVIKRPLLCIESDSALKNVGLMDATGIGICLAGNTEISGSVISHCSIGARCFRNASPSITNTRISYCVQSGIDAKKDSKPQIKNCEIFSNKNVGISICENAVPVIEKCNIHDNEQCGVEIQDSAAGAFSDCKIHGNSSNGIKTSGGSNGTFRVCHIYDNKRCGMWITENSVPVVEKCKIYNNRTEDKLYSGILADDDSKPQINGCEISGHLSDGIWERERASGTYTNCSIHDNEQRGICIQDSTSGTFANCDIHDNTCQGILACGDAKGTFKNSHIHNNKRNGLHIYEKAAPIVEKCKIHDNKTEGENYPGVVISGDSKPNISNCEIFGHLSDGIWERDRASGTYVNCNIHNNEQRGIEIQDSASGTFSNCEIHGNKWEGIRAHDNASPVVEKCDVHDNEQNGIKIQDSASGTFSSCDIHDNEVCGVQIAENAVPVIDKCKIHDNKTEGKVCHGVYVSGDSEPSISECEIFGHLDDGVRVCNQASGTYTNCKIHDNNCGVNIFDSASGTFSNCEIYANSRAGRVSPKNSKGAFKYCNIHGNEDDEISFIDDLHFFAQEIVRNFRKK